MKFFLKVDLRTGKFIKSGDAAIVTLIPSKPLLMIFILF
jgi:hypothetical protein